ncbi:Stress enhanced protein 1 chloroplastic [Bienertia sinuspersici]
MALSNASASFNLSVYDACKFNPTKLGTVSRLPTSNFARNAISFLRGSPLVTRSSSAQLKVARKANSASIKCEQSTEGGSGLDVWLGRIAMIGFAVAISVEVSTGKGLLEVGALIPLNTNLIVGALEVYVTCAMDFRLRFLSQVGSIRTSMD